VTDTAGNPVSSFEQKLLESGAGESGAATGKFTLTVYEGQPLYQGSVTVGPME
jgi:hypothetical protein